MRLEAHSTPERMIRCLVSYIPDDARVLRAVRTEFGKPVRISTVRSIRRNEAARKERINRGMQATGADEKGWDWRGDKYSDGMAMASHVFLAAIEREMKQSHA